MKLKALSKNKKIIKFSLAVLFLLSVIGLFLIGSILHENIHRLDFKDINKSDEDICYLKLGNSLQSSAAHYRFNYTSEERDDVEKISEYAEFKAYGANVILIIIYMFCFFMSLNWIKEKFEK